MADIATAVISDSILRSWDIPPVSAYTAIPRGEVLFTGSQAIPLKVAADESLFTLVCNFPRNFVYRLVEARVVVFTPNATDLSDWEPGMRVLVSTDEPDIPDWNFALLSPEMSGSGNAQWVFNFESVTNHHISIFQVMAGLAADVSSPIDCAKGLGRLFLNWADVSADETAITVVDWRFRALQYDVDQYRRFPMHAPGPIISP